MPRFRRGELVHGNELLFERDASYPRQSTYRLHQHTLDAVIAVLDQESLLLSPATWPVGVSQAWEGFLGYLLLDALIVNTDRHHQNWGLVVELEDGRRWLAPTFDHASSFGRELTDAERTRRLSTNDKRGDVEAYLARARSAFYGLDGKALTPVEAFVHAARHRPVAGRAWLERLDTTKPADWAPMLRRVPGQRMSDAAKDFALALLASAHRLAPRPARAPGPRPSDRDTAPDHGANGTLRHP